jgi:hypothetical protein
MRKLSLVGKHFGRLIVLKLQPSNSCGDSMWLCKCHCGEHKTVRGMSLKLGATKSCGCLRVELSRKHQLKHGQAGGKNKPTKLYWIWQAMMKRCRDKNCKDWPLYGGRGIKVCKRWHNFKNFFADVGQRPRGKSLDRFPDNDGNYKPGNWRWATAKQQASNTRRAKATCSRRSSKER